MSNADALIEKIRALPAEQVAEVEDFVDFINHKARRRAALDQLLAVAPALEAAGSTPVSESDLSAEIKIVRESRRSSNAARGASRS